MANVKLSSAELELVTNASVILTKNRIITKVYTLFGDIAAFYVSELHQNSSIPDAIKQISPKIARGENYEGLPWVMLDYPRYFTRDEEFAVRTYFWWGNFFSITLQLSGSCQQQYAKEVSALAKSGKWMMGTGEDKWQHHFREDNYKAAFTVDEERIRSLPFIKIAKKVPLHEWDTVEVFLKTSFREIVKAIAF